jgi:hypothetical protein
MNLRMQKMMGTMRRTIPAMTLSCMAHLQQHAAAAGSQGTMGRAGHLGALLLLNKVRQSRPRLLQQLTDSMLRCDALWQHRRPCRNLGCLHACFLTSKLFLLAVLQMVQQAATPAGSAGAAPLTSSSSSPPLAAPQQ